MKTSFYFVLWILIYPLLGMLGIPFVNNNAFIVALLIVWGLSWLLKHLMPKTLTYEHALENIPIFEEIYTGNVAAFRKRITRDRWIATVTAIYFIVTTIVIAYAVFKSGDPDWVALAVFGFLTFVAISRSSQLIKAGSQLKVNPTSEQCAEIADETYGLNYASYAEARTVASYHDMFPPKPRSFPVFKIFSIVMAVLAIILGLLNIVPL